MNLAWVLFFVQCRGTKRRWTFWHGTGQTFLAVFPHPPSGAGRPGNQRSRRPGDLADHTGALARASNEPSKTGPTSSSPTTVKAASSPPPCTGERGEVRRKDPQKSSNSSARARRSPSRKLHSMCGRDRPGDQETDRETEDPGQDPAHRSGQGRSPGDDRVRAPPPP